MSVPPPKPPGRGTEVNIRPQSEFEIQIFIEAHYSFVLKLQVPYLSFRGELLHNIFNFKTIFTCWISQIIVKYFKGFDW